ncbi:hypothetical protein M501DRAFT_435586 [Patellaria atrata CBS 101060]|uniref:Uncharacterized protein n=1 Tax=Patellaria atrata CBS 101060 TaxID=1346257 RepID=A0A9P4S5N0_9PEZI|nr:hypothetical protein M501DRAFT_435586 [Patellaria atrata CBS 101060]
MSIVRAFTRRSKRTETPSFSPIRTASTKQNGQMVDRKQISGPVALISTTNMLSYDAPDIPTMRHVSSSSVSSSSSSTAEDSDHSAANLSGADTDATSVTSSPTSPEPNHLSCYFPQPTQKPRRSTSTTSFPRASELSIDAPAIPKRALSHSKKAHEQIARQRSIRSMSARSSLSSREQRSSVDMFRTSVEPNHPFGKELEQLNEVAEEFGNVAKDADAAQIDEDNHFMQQHGLVKFCASDYLMEIQPLYSNIFGDISLPSPQWI